MSREVFDWFEEDAHLIEQESTRLKEEQQAWIREQDQLTALDEANHEWKEFVEAMTVDELELCVEGFEQYAQDLQRERDMELGWHRWID